ncbi:C2 calcium-dependent membrane targeting [Macleaya cordata]|uniref:C2 calcium-dependent membrane targeting n=1 Tax=Macleaya cordata TaxID=56857 RepID=A0A200QQ18_MACCD|nr:C2 calcium-dependent membrane targeting [Macleaya cordata]
MGGCLSDVRGGQEAVGGNKTDPTTTTDMGSSGGGGGTTHNDAVDFFFRSHGCHGLFSQLELSLSATGLRDLDVFSKSDPMAVVYAKKIDGKLEEIGRTEVIMNSLDPVWIRKVSIVYQFEIVQPLVFRVYDIDTKYLNFSVKTLKLDEQDFLGEASCALSEIVTKHNKSLALKLIERNGQGGMRHQGTLTVHAEETVASRQAVEMIFRCSKLDNKDLFSKSDPFLRISRIVEGGTIPVYKTEVVKNNLNPTWKPVCLSAQQFGSKASLLLDTPLVIECFDFNNSGSHELIGKIQKSVADLEKLHLEKVGENFRIPTSSTRKNHMKVMLKGQLFVDRFSEKTRYSFLDYISSGFELNFMVAVDFTASNGNPHLPTSLHYIDPSGRLNAYQQAIFEVGEVVQFYDSDKRFPAWGFGGRPINGVVSHCFNLNGSPSEFEVEGVNGIMSAYSSALHNVVLAGPTLFGKVIDRASQIASQSLHNQTKYFVLLIITDGVLTDLQESIDALVRASDLPLSILIVGVGGADFTQMEILDADKGKRLESSTGRIATRDIVQFVPMREVQGGQISIVQSLLEELPGQFLTYMRSRDIKPLFVNEAQTSA